MHERASSRTSILLIDDSASVRDVLRVTLESEGYTVLEATGGREGLRLHRKHRPGLVLVDSVMPDKNGIETVKEILAIDPGAVIFTMSGKGMAEDHNEVARMLGAKRGFRKPPRLEELLGAIDTELAVLSLPPPPWLPDLSSTGAERGAVARREARAADGLHLFQEVSDRRKSSTSSSRALRSSSIFWNSNRSLLHFLLSAAVERGARIVPQCPRATFV